MSVSSFDTDCIISTPLLMASPSKRSHGCSTSPAGKRLKTNAVDKAIKEAEREEKRLRQEEKRQQLEAKRKAKEAERKLKEEERRAKEDERRLKEEERRSRDEEKRVKKEAEELLKRATAEALEKKEKSQLRMGNFFKKVVVKSVPVLATEQGALFKPFYLKEHTRLAHIIRAPKVASELFAGELDADSTHITIKSAINLHSRKRRYRGIRSLLTLKERLLESSNVTIETRLQDIKYKLLQFQTDVRPAYFGTMSSSPSVKGLKTGRNPLARAEQLNYDYDSEADWVQGDDDDEGGEDLADDDDMSDVSKDTYGEDDDDFLDDNEEVMHESRHQGQMIPSIMGIFPPEDDLNSKMQLQKLVNTELPIDPFENYWDPKPVMTSTPVPEECGSDKLMRHPLMSKINGKNSCDAGATVPFPDCLLSDFKKAIQGSTLKKAMLVEKLRTDFQPHKVTKKVIESKLGEVAHRQGKGQHDVWILL